MTRSLEKKTNKKPSSHSLGVCFVRPLMLHILVPFLPGPFFMTFSQSFAEMRIRTEIQRSLSLFVLYIQIGSISGQEEGDWCTALFIGTLCSQTHKKLEMEKKEFFITSVTRCTNTVVHVEYIFIKSNASSSTAPERPNGQLRIGKFSKYHQKKNFSNLLSLTFAQTSCSPKRIKKRALDLKKNLNFLSHI